MKDIVEEKSFLDFDAKIKKKSLKDIKDSYNNYWDILTEVIQNSVDAIIRKNAKKGYIKITFNEHNKSITIYDDGIGISNNLLPGLLTPFSTDKETEYNSRGEKGVGLSFVIFETNSFKIKTSYIDSNITTIGVIQNARSWVESDENDDIVMNQTTRQEKFVGTEITLKQLDSNKIFDLSIDQLIYILRTKTAIGDLLSLFGKSAIDISIDLIFIDKSGKQECKKVPYKYFLPIENKKNCIEYDDELKDFLTNSDISDSEKRERIKNKIVYLNGYDNVGNGIELQYWACIVPDRKVWEEINHNKNLISLSDAESEASICFNPGITIASKGMPTAIDYPQPSRLGNAGYFPNFFMIINDDSYVPDIGRKAVMDEYKNNYNAIIRRVFNKLASEVGPFMKDDVDNDWDKFNLKEEIDNLPKLKTKLIKFKCSPFEQEASIAAIFFELIGKDLCFKDFVPYHSAYRSRYDLYGYYRKHFVTLEFKYNLKNIVKDFKTCKKMADEIDYVVCWDVSERDEDELNRKLGAKIEPIDISDYDKTCRYMPEVTHKIVYSNYANPVYVIDLKIVINLLDTDLKVYTIE